MVERQSKRRGGDMGGRRPLIGKVRSIKVSDEHWAFCLSEPGGAGGFIRKVVQNAIDHRAFQKLHPIEQSRLKEAKKEAAEKAKQDEINALKAQLKPGHKICWTCKSIQDKDNFGGVTKADCKEYVEVVAVKSQQQRCKQLKIPGSFTVHEWQKIKKEANYKCVHCGEVKPLEMDHIIPVSKPESTNSIDNIQCLCRKCNAIKGNKSPAQSE